MRNHQWRLAAGLAAIVAPLLMWSEFLAMGLSRHGYNMLLRPFSDLATRGTQNATVFDLGFFLAPGILTVVVGLGLWHGLPGGRAWRVGSLMIVAAGVLLFATGVFQQDPRSFVAGVLHGTMAQTTFGIASVAPLILFLGSAEHLHVSPPRRIWLGAGLATFAIEGLGVAMHAVTHYPDGFFQRPFTLVLTIWFVATGAWLLRVRRFEGLSVPEPAR